MKINTLIFAMTSVIMASMQAAPRFIITTFNNQTSKELELRIAKKQRAHFAANSIKAVNIALPLDTIKLGYISPSSWKKADNEAFTNDNLDVQSDVMITDADNTTEYQLYYQLTQYRKSMKAMIQLQTADGTTVASWNHEFSDMSVAQTDNVTCNISFHFIEKQSGMIVPADATISVIVENQQAS